MRRKEDRTTQILALLVQEKKIEVIKSQSARIWTPWKHRA